MPASSLAWSTIDPDEFVERIGAVAPDVSVTPRNGRFHASVVMSALKEIDIFAIRMDDAVVRRLPLDYLSLTVPLTGAFESEVSGRLSAIDPGTVHVSGGNDFYLQTGRDTGRLLVLNFSGKMVNDHTDDAG